VTCDSRTSMKCAEHKVYRADAKPCTHSTGVQPRVFMKIFRYRSEGCGSDWTAYGSQPIVTVGFGAAGQGEKFFL
jgi:hypothetical protein